MFYSKSTGGFYTTEIHGEAIPADAIEVTDAEHAALMHGQTLGQMIGADKNGNPVLVDPPAPDMQVAIASRLTQLRAVREEILNRLSGIAGRAQRKGDSATAIACDVASQSLLDITKGLPIDLEGVTTVVTSRYQALVGIAANTAPGLVSAFTGVDL